MTDLRARLRRLPLDLSAALAFFSRLPVKVPQRPFDLREVSAAWPLAGMLLALIPSLVLLVGLELHLGNMVIAALMIGATIVAGGGLHEDGLADTADGFGGGRTAERKLEIMRDSRLGSYGALALVVLVALKVGALVPLLAQPVHAVVALLGTAALSRGLALWHWRTTLPARQEGLAWSAGRPDGISLAIGGVFATLAGFILLAVFGGSAVVGLALAFAGVAAFTRTCWSQIGGHTGDTVGASQQIAEALLLVGLSSAWPPLLAVPPA